MKKKWEYRKHEGWRNHEDIYERICTQCGHAERIEKEQYEEGIKEAKA